MKKFSIKYLLILFAGASILASCKKESENIFNMFKDVEVTYHNNTPYAVTDYKDVNVNDSVHLSFTISSANKSMYTVCVWEAGSGSPFLKFTTKPEERKKYSNIVRLKMDQASRRVGLTSFRVWALDSTGTYIGDGYKTVKVNVLPDYYYYTNRTLFVPDTVEKTSKSYLSLTTGNTYSYSEGEANSDKIDLGVLFVPTPTTNPPSTNPGVFNIYALNTTPVPYNQYDISNWTKRATVFSSLRTNQTSTFNNIRTGALLEKNAKSANPANKSVNLTSGNAATAGNMVYFKTPEGKFGALLVKYVSAHSAKKGTMINFEIKIQK